MTLEQHTTTNDDSRFDRLVDGEMSKEEYRTLLISLDDEPDGWRRCATAFLEAQAWNRELGGIRSEADIPSRTTFSRTMWIPSSTLSIVLAMAASFLITLGLGLMLRTWWPAASANSTNVVDNRGGQSASDSPNSVDRQPALADNGNQSQAPQVAAASHNPLGHVRLVVDRGDGLSSVPVEVPFYDMDQFDPYWLSDEAFSLPPDVVRTLNRMGHQVNRNHQFVPIDLEDGRRVVIPVEQVEIMPVSNQFYQ